jgi:diguanylate cyclase (GGDEF)-like protein
MPGNVLANWSNYLNNRSANTIVITAIACTALLGFLDHRIGENLSMTFFYLLPVSFVAWFAGKKSALLVSLLCTATWLFSNFQPDLELSSFFQHLWNGLSTFGFFSVVVILLAKLRGALVQSRMLSVTDYLTGTMNCRGFDEIVSHEIRRHKRNGQSLTLAYLDLDNFKAVNDTLGHDVGDELLKIVAGTMISSLRSTDLVARVGGDEFAILLPETNIQAANTAIAKVQKNLLLKMAENGWPVTSSIGVLTCETPIQNPREMMTLADKLMYAVKKAGKNALRHAVYQGQRTPDKGPELVPVAV